MRTLCGILGPEFESHQYFYVYKCVGQKCSVVMLVVKRSAGVAPKVNPRHTMYADSQALK